MHLQLRPPWNSEKSTGNIWLLGVLFFRVHQLPSHLLHGLVAKAILVLKRSSRLWRHPIFHWNMELLKERVAFLTNSRPVFHSVSTNFVHRSKITLKMDHDLSSQGSEEAPRKMQSFVGWSISGKWKSGNWSLLLICQVYQYTVYENSNLYQTIHVDPCRWFWALWFWMFSYFVGQASM